MNLIAVSFSPVCAHHFGGPGPMVEFVFPMTVAMFIAITCFMVCRRVERLRRSKKLNRDHLPAAGALMVLALMQIVTCVLLALTYVPDYLSIDLTFLRSPERLEMAAREARVWFYAPAILGAAGLLWAAALWEATVFGVLCTAPRRRRRQRRRRPPVVWQRTHTWRRMIARGMRRDLVTTARDWSLVVAVGGLVIGLPVMLGYRGF